MMAKHRVAGASTSKMTVMVFQFEGDDATLQEGLRTVSAALTRALPGPARAHSAIAAAASATPKEHEAPESEIDVDDDSSEVIDGTATVAKSPRRPPKSPEIVEIDLTKGAVPLQDYLKKHPVEEVSKRYLLIANWLKVNHSLEEISASHIHTCFRHMGWQTPRNAVQPLRDMKSKQQWFSKGTQRGFYKLNHVGENEVMRITESKS